MTLAIIVPTYKRANDLQRTLESVSNLDAMPEEVIVVVGPNDAEGLFIAKSFDLKIKGLKVLVSEKPSVIYAVNKGIAESKADIVCLTDDDVSVPKGWTSKIKEAYLNDNRLGALGGQDRIQYEQKAHISNAPPADIVGLYRWTGELIGNHHNGAKNSPIDVDVLKGVNLSFRRNAFTDLQIDSVMIGKGAEPGYEAYICLSIKKAGYKVMYDNNTYLLHFGSPRSEYDVREDLFSSTHVTRNFNEGFVRGKFRPYHEMLLYLLSSFIKGSRFQPGIVWSILHLKKHGLKVLMLPFKKTLSIYRGLLCGIGCRY